MTRLRTAIASIGLVVWVVLVGSFAALDTSQLRTGFAWGVVTMAPAFLVAGWIIEGERRP